MNITNNHAPITVNNHYYAAPAMQGVSQADYIPKYDECMEAQDEACAAPVCEATDKDTERHLRKIASLLERNQDLEDQLTDANQELEVGRELRVALAEELSKAQQEIEELKTANAKMRKTLHQELDEEDERRIEAYQHRTPELSKEKEERERYELAYMLRNRSEEDQRILLGIGEDADLELHKKRNGLDIIDKQIAEYIAENGTDLPAFPEAERLKEEKAAQETEEVDVPWKEEAEAPVAEKTVVRTWNTASRAYTEYSDGSKAWVALETPEVVSAPAEELNVEDYVVDEEEPAPVEETPAPKSFLNVKPKSEEAEEAPAPTSLMSKLKRTGTPLATPDVFAKPVQEEEEVKELVEEGEVKPAPVNAFKGFGNSQNTTKEVAPVEETVPTKPVFNPFGR